MTGHDALLRAVIENPDDDLPRLVYADWLEEYDRPELARVYRGDCWRRGANPYNQLHFTHHYPDLCDRLVYMPGATPGVVKLVERGVVFVMAWWSGPSRQAFAALAEALRLGDPDGRSIIVVVDADGIGEEFYHELFEPLRAQVGGAGEGVWIRGGRPFLVTRCGNTLAHLRVAIREALGEP